MEFDGRAFDTALRQKLRNLERNTDRAVGQLADDTVAVMRDRVPKDTGATADSIEVRRRRGGERELVMGGASIFLIFGTSKMAARDFARPTLAQAPRRFEPPNYD